MGSRTTPQYRGSRRTKRKLRRRWREGSWPRGICLSKTRSGLRAGEACPVRLSGYGRRTFSAPSRHHLRQEPSAVIPHARICAGGTGQPVSLPRPLFFRFTLPDHGHCPTYLFFFSFFIFLFSLRLFCGAFLLSFTPLLFSFIIPSSLESFYVLVFPSYKKGERPPQSLSLFTILSAQSRRE